MTFGIQRDLQGRSYSRYDSLSLSSYIQIVLVGYRNETNKRRQVLVRIYTDLLEFYFGAMDVLKSGSFFIGLQKSRFRQKLPEIVSSFTDNTEQLDKLINLESLVLIQKIDDDQCSIKGKYLIKMQTSKLT
jgi:CMP-N-acetylneuraminic acid synthetase